MSGQRTILLGPQRYRTMVGRAIADAGVPENALIATVTAGWEERELEDAALQEQLGDRGHNLLLSERLVDVLRHDDRFAKAAGAYRDAVDEFAGVYSLRLQRALDAAYAVARRPLRHDVADSARADSIRELKEIDAWYLAAVDQLLGELEVAAPAAESEVLMRHRAEVHATLDRAGALAIAGGHVGTLTRCLRLFDVSPGPELPVVAWSAGAMALTDRVVLFHDFGPTGLVGAEIWDRGLGRAPGIVAFPHAKRRLRTDDPMVLSVLAARFAPARCLLLDDGNRLSLGPGGALPSGARVIGTSGQIEVVGDPGTGAVA